eukprot:TRINITY_DN9079_c0_g2_i1.p1 TRINITY_DN9079_c0_g2~~TRINITY_DN9079_c0_g2_i1.p1  ORF type:complete len:274 (-),score=56.27 TRINITY_DN9079_c0_g2_i1:316-1137(-)
MESGDPFSESLVQHLVGQLVSSVKRIHEFGAIHRNIKLESLATVNDSLNLHLTGFHCSTIKDRIKFIGSISYMAPEMIRKETYTNKVDVWAIGIITYSLLYGSPPFDGEDDDEVLMETIELCDLQFPSDVTVSSKGQDFISRCLEYDPSNRADIWKLMQHPWLGLQPPTPVQSIEDEVRKQYKKERKRCVAIVDVNAEPCQGNSLLSFKTGDTIYVVEQGEEGWWYGELENGTQGWFSLTQAPYKRKEIRLKQSSGSLIQAIQADLKAKGLFK